MLATIDIREVSNDASNIYSCFHFVRTLKKPYIMSSPNFKQNQSYLVIPKDSIIEKFPAIKDRLKQEIMFSHTDGDMHFFNNNFVIADEDLEHLEFFEIESKTHPFKLTRQTSPDKNITSIGFELPDRDDNESEEDEDEEDEFEGLRIIHVDPTKPNSVPEPIRMAICAQMFKSLSGEAQAFLLNDFHNLCDEMF